ncbi:MAG: hypothetical protein Q8Q31_03485 [Nanoarchaeota archaeon]|nr:hypothetical protein [Nanoarchaeota archaeon]
MIVTKSDLHLSKAEELSNFYDIYYNWIVSLFSNVGATTANVVKLDWFPQANSTLK